MPHVCPWWGGYFIDNPLRRLFHNPEKIVGPYVKPGMTAMDIGCGMGFCSIAMAKIVRDSGQVIAIDLQQKMLEVLRKRTEKAGVADRILLHKCQQNRLGVIAQADFALAFMMVHEVPDQRRLLTEIQACLKPGGKLLVAEPKIHVPGKAFGRTVALAGEVGLNAVEEPRVHGCRAALLLKG
jgi:ubiquinone/menaquinone biosynthesis C-methylase UbiE